MKEKTFEELIIQSFPNHELTKDRWSFELIQFSADDLVDFGIKIRETTKEEVLKLADDNFFSKEPKGKLMENIENLPTDKIKTDEKA